MLLGIIGIRGLGFIIIGLRGLGFIGIRGCKALHHCVCRMRCKDLPQLATATVRPCPHLRL